MNAHQTTHFGVFRDPEVIYRDIQSDTLEGITITIATDGHHWYCGWYTPFQMTFCRKYSEPYGSRPEAINAAIANIHSEYHKPGAYQNPRDIYERFCEWDTRLVRESITLSAKP